MTGLALWNRTSSLAIGAAAATLTAVGGALLAIDVPAAEALGLAALAGLLAGAAGILGAAGARHTFRSSIAAAVDRLGSAALGDLEAEVPARLRQGAPALATALEELFHKLHGNLESVHRLAMFDTVTGLANRPHFRRSAERMLEEGGDEAAAVLFFIDLDRFKAVNDTMGHAVGDVMLSMVANRLRAVADRFAALGRGEPPLIGRLAGDEFTLFFAHLPDPAEAERIGGGIIAALTEPFALAGQEVSIGASIGIARFPYHGRNLHELMRSADAAMYHAKARGRGRVESFSDGLAADMAERVRLESELRAAIERREFTLVFQPQLSAADGRIVGAEALLRWQHPEGMKLPAAFLTRAEETGLIVEIGDWVVAQMASTLARWGRMGIEQRLAINVSAREIDDAGYFRRLRAAMLAAKAPAHLLELELSETLAMHCSEAVLRAIAALRADGASIAIDDFGTGYSNLARLKRMPVDRVKLDGSVIEHIADSPDARGIAQAVIALIHGLGCEAVAEGIETEAQAAVLRIIGCDVLQGYAMGAPMAEADFLAWAQDMTPCCAIG